MRVAGFLEKRYGLRWKVLFFERTDQGESGIADAVAIPGRFAIDAVGIDAAYQGERLFPDFFKFFSLTSHRCPSKRRFLSPVCGPVSDCQFVPWFLLVV